MVVGGGGWGVGGCGLGDWGDEERILIISILTRKIREKCYF